MPKPDGVFRIMVLGDSLTWGAGLAVEERYTNQFAIKLQQAYPQKQLEVLNFGVMGGPTVLERDILVKFKDLVRPDLLIIGFCLNDPQPKSQYWSEERESFDRKWGIVIYTVGEMLHRIGARRVGEYVIRGVYHAAEMIGRIPPWTEAIDRVYHTDSKEWRDFVQALQDIRSICDESGLPQPVFAVLNHGFYSDRPTDYRHPDKQLQLFLKWYNQAQAAAEEIGFVTVNMEEAIKQKLPNSILAVNAVDSHPNKELNAVYAEELFNVIKKLLDEK
ncbi:MAG: hypothetical protein JXA82_17960 [Sedimentisphaerales bacterium]|nr:hypothetical protein [Sedimentisphaerales bacterium]